MAFIPRECFPWRLRTRTLSLGERTAVMAIINLTPDSFSGDGLLPGNIAGSSIPSSSIPGSSIPGSSSPASGASLKRALSAAMAALEAGADILDLGAESTRPGAEPLTEGEEQRRLLPVLEALLAARPDALVSVDTYHAATARAALQAGAEIINDVSGMEWDRDMTRVVAETGCGLVLMHTRGRPQEWQAQAPLGRGGVLPAVFAGLCERLALAEAAGIASERIVLDPGFGFGKLGGENLELLAGLGRLAELGRPLLAGLSRKRFLADLAGPHQAYVTRSTGQPAPGVAEARRIPSLAANVAAVLAGAHIVRVHDVVETGPALAVADGVLAGAADAVPAGVVRPPSV